MKVVHLLFLGILLYLTVWTVVTLDSSENSKIRGDKNRDPPDCSYFHYKKQIIVHIYCAFVGQM